MRDGARQRHPRADGFGKGKGTDPRVGKRRPTRHTASWTPARRKSRGFLTHCSRQNRRSRERETPWPSGWAVKDSNLRPWDKSRHARSRLVSPFPLRKQVLGPIEALPSRVVSARLVPTPVATPVGREMGNAVSQDAGPDAPGARRARPPSRSRARRTQRHDPYWAAFLLRDSGVTSAVYY
jgi:hypothetical protein